MGFGFRMIDLPDVAQDDTVALADWLELNALFSPSGSVSAAELSASIGFGGLLSGSRGERYESDGPLAENDLVFSADDEAEIFSEVLLAHLRDRLTALGALYPFEILPGVIQRRVDSASEVPSFALLLVISVLPHYARRITLTRLPPRGRSFQFLFEQVVRASHASMFGGATARFGWPREAGWPKSFDARLRRFAREMTVRPSLAAARQVVKGNDAGLDIAARWSFGDDDKGSLVFLTQCATGQNWREKTGEPSLEKMAAPGDWTRIPG